MVEINFLCVHKKLRSKRVAPVLIKEITRRVNKEGIFQAVYTAGVLLPKPISVCQYWHRSLNPKKLVEVHFSALHKHMTLQRMIKLYRLPEVCVYVCVCVGVGGYLRSSCEKIPTISQKLAIWWYIFLPPNYNSYRIHVHKTIPSNLNPPVPFNMLFGANHQI